MANIVPCLSFSFREEGAYVNDPNDAGGPTNMGITLGTLSKWRGTICTARDVLALTRAEAATIYQVEYWDGIEGDSLPAGLDLMVLDHAITCGVFASARLLQQTLKVVADGSIGPVTLAAAAGNPQTIRTRIMSLGLAQANDYRRMAAFSRYGKGWLARTTRRQIAANALTLVGVSDDTSQET
jgi:lysozyme family protein